MIAQQPASVKRAAPPPLIHLAPSKNPEVALCGARRDGRPLKPNVEPTCVVCIDLSKTWRRRLA